MKTKSKTIKAAKAQEPERLVNDAQRVFVEADFPVGSAAHQGDLILVRVAALPDSARLRANRQLADGQTQGSRHMLEAGEAFDCDAAEVLALILAVCPRAKIGPQYVGPVFRTVGGAADLLHPEHGDHLYRGDMTLAVVYQRNLDVEEREARVQD